MKTTKRGVTLVEVVIIVCIIGVLVAMVGGLGLRCVDSQDGATKQAQAWATKMGLKNPRVDCASRDTDGDGYVSCNVAYDDNGSTKIVPVECSANFTMNTGCRTPKAVFNKTN